nr:hypothetical protein [Tanacetum cinerariifolium]
MTGDDNHDGDQLETLNPSQPIPPPTSQLHHTNVAFVSAYNTSRTNDVSTAYSVSSPSILKSQKEGSASYTDEVIHSFFANQSSAPQLDCDDLEQINDDDLEKMDLKWQVAMISMRIKKFHKRTERKLQFDTKDTVGFDKTKLECFNCHKIRHFARDYKAKGNRRRRDGGYNGNKARDNYRRPAYQDASKALVTIDGEAVDWFGHVEDDTQNFVMMAYSSSNSSFDNEVQSCSKTCAESYARLKKLYDEQRDKLSVASVEITAYTLALKRPQQVVIGETKEIHGIKSSNTTVDQGLEKDDPHKALKNKGIIDSGCSSNGRITGKGKIKAGMLDFEDVYYVEELKHYNLFPVSQLCDKKNKVLFTDTDCLVLSPNFKFPDENQKGKQHKASCKAKTVSSVNQSLEILHMDLFRPTSVRSINHKTYCLFITDGFSRSDNGTEFKNHDLIELCGLKRIKREYSNAKTLQQNGVAEKKNRTLSEAAGTMLADLFYLLHFGQRQLILLVMFLIGPFGCHVTILNTIDQLGKFDGKSDSGFLVGYSLNSKDFRVYNLETKRVEENLHVNFLENKPNVAGKGHAWMFDLDYLTNSMNYEPVSLENQANKSAGPKEANHNAGTEANDDQDANSKEINLYDEHFVLPVWFAYSTSVKSSRDKIRKNEKPVSQVEQFFQEELKKLKRQEKEANNAAKKEATYETRDVNTNSINLLNVVSTPVSVVGSLRDLNDVEPSYSDDLSMPHFEDIYASLMEPKKISQALEDKSWVDAMQEEFLQFQIQKAWVLVDLPFGKKAIGTKWVYRNKKDERGFVVRNKAGLVAQGHRKEEGIDYDEVFAPVARIEAIRIFLAFASYMGFIVYQIDVKSAFLYGTINEEVYVTQPPRFIDPKFPNKVYKVVKSLYGLHQVPKACVKTASTPIETQKPLVKDEEAADVDVYLYRSMIGSLMYLTASRPDIVFAACACSRFQVTPRTSHLQAVNRIFSGQVLWIQNQLLDYGFNLMYTKIYIDNESTNCIVNKLVFHSKTKHIEIRHHFIRDAYEKKLIQVLKIHTDDNVADLLTKAFDVLSKELASPKHTALDMDEDVQVNLEEAQANAYNLDLQHANKSLTCRILIKKSLLKWKKCLSLKRKPMTEAQARKNMMIYLKNMAGFKMYFFKVEEVLEVVKAAKIMTEVVTTAQPTTTAAQVLKPSASRRRRGVIIQDHEEIAASVIVHLRVYSKDKGKGILIEEPKPLKGQVMANDDDDDVFTEATPIASKVPFVDYLIHHEKNKPYYKIIRADETHKFKSTEPKNFSDDFLLNTFKIMFEKPNVEANVWRDQKGRYGLAKVKSWKLFESCGVHVLILTT